MRKFFLLAALTCILITANSQEFAHFRWKTKSVEFNSGEMKIEDTRTEKEFFNGKKNSSIKISNDSDDPKKAKLDLKLGEYFSVSDATVDKFDYEITEKGIVVGYTVVNGYKLARILFNYYSGEQKPAFIIVVAYDNYAQQTAKKQTFTLREIK